MTTKPLVTIVTSCFNQGAYLDDYFKGLLAQTYLNIELIIHDDGSSDDSWEKICAYKPALEERYTRVICERCANIGYSRQLACLLKKATGKYFCILDSDDYYLPDKIAENVAFLETNPDYGFVHSEHHLIEGDKLIENINRQSQIPIKTGKVFEHILSHYFIRSVAACCRTDLLKKWVDFESYYEKGYVTPDEPYFLELSTHTLFGYIDKPLACYRVLPESMCHFKDPGKKHRFAKGVYRIKLDYMRKYGAGPRARKIVQLSFHRSFFMTHYLMLQRREAEQEYRWLVRHDKSRTYFFYKIRLMTMANKLVWKAAVWMDGRLTISPAGRSLHRLAIGTPASLSGADVLRNSGCSHGDSESEVRGILKNLRAWCPEVIQKARSRGERG